MSYAATVRFRRFFSGIPKIVDTVGEQALFYGESIRYIPNALTRYRK
ncbi:ABC transporter permease, partial [Mycobacterium sp. ITM-2017-0098]